MRRHGRRERGYALGRSRQVGNNEADTRVKFARVPLERSRPALQDKLWSDRGPAQGAASLRQTLTEIRQAFGDRYRDCLVTDMRGIGLAQGGVSVDIDTADLSELARMVELPQLLEDIDVADEEFEDWLRQQRTAFEQRMMALRTAATARPAIPEPEFLLRHAGPAVRPWLRLLPPLTVTSESGFFLSRLVADRRCGICLLMSCVSGHPPSARIARWARETPSIVIDCRGITRSPGRPQGIQIEFVPWALARAVIDERMSPWVLRQLVAVQVRSVPARNAGRARDQSLQPLLGCRIGPDIEFVDIEHGSQALN